MRKDIFKFIKDINYGVNYFTIPVMQVDTVRLTLRPITRNLKNYEIELMAKWRAKNQHIFKDPNPITIEGTRKWFLETYTDRRLLFFIKEGLQYIGHLGIYRIDVKDDSLEIDNVIRGRSQNKGIMHLSLATLIKWIYKVLKPKKIYLAVLKENIHAIEFYKKNGFVIEKEIELKNNPHYKMKYDPSTGSGLC